VSRWSVEVPDWGILVHGGAGRVPERSRAVHEAGCRRAAAAGAQRLAEGGTALDAVQAAVEVLEDDPHFNAATGAALTADANLELDAAVMDGATLAAGAVCALPAFRHPVAVARAVLAEGRHVMYAGAGAGRFARAAGFEPDAADDMITEAARRRLDRARAEGRAQSWAGDTVGAVARDAHGHLAAATSTGGTVGKRPGRIGDSPLIGVGTFADDALAAIGATGDGEAIIRSALCAGALHRLRSGEPVDAALAAVLAEMQERLSGTGGLIAVTPSGRLGWARTTPSMSWAACWRGGSEAGI
jgi:beta-aspartyl-peptidase (threonine type)